MRPFFILLTVAFLVWPLAPVNAAEGPFITEHTGEFNGHAVRYKATVSETLVDKNGLAPAVDYWTTSYVRTDVSDRTPRPVVFFFNGGPGASSELLQIGAFGPRRAKISNDPKAPNPVGAALIDNLNSPLDVADLVFLDPAETGFSRVAPGEDRAKAYSTAGDAQSIADLISTWLTANGRRTSPRYVVGESYGTIRAALVAGLLSKSLPLNGVVLISQAANIIETSQRDSNVIGYATNITALAAIAAYHGRADLHGETLGAFVDEVYAWGMTDYLQALVKGDDISPKERRGIATKLQAYTGINADYYLAHNLMITKAAFRSELLRDQGLVLGVADARYVGPAPRRGEPAADPFSVVQRSFGPLMKSYLSDELKVSLPGDAYRSLAPDANTWVYNPTRGDGGPFSDWDYSASITAAMKANPDFRLMITTGFFDTMTAIGPAQYMVQQSHWPKNRVMMRRYLGGHTTYTYEPSLIALTGDVRTFLQDHH